MRISRPCCALARTDLGGIPAIAGRNLLYDVLMPDFGHSSLTRILHAPFVDIDVERKARDERALTDLGVDRLIDALLRALVQMIAHPARHFVAMSWIGKI